MIAKAIDGFTDQFRAYAEEAVKQERAACIEAVMNERLDVADTQGDADEAYNTALCHAAGAIRSRTAVPAKE